MDYNIMVDMFGKEIAIQILLGVIETQQELIDRLIEQNEILKEQIIEEAESEGE